MTIDLRPETVNEWKNPSFLAKRVRNHHFQASAKMQFVTKKENEKAGLVLYRKSSVHYQLLRHKNAIVLIKTTAKDVKSEKGMSQEVSKMPYKEKEVVLKIVGEGCKVTFYFGSDDANLQQIGETQDLSNFGDEIAWGFNGTYVGMYATSNGNDSNAKVEFDWFELK